MIIHDILKLDEIHSPPSYSELDEKFMIWVTGGKAFREPRRKRDVHMGKDCGS